MSNRMMKAVSLILVLALSMSLLMMTTGCTEKTVTLTYAHTDTEDSVTGRQAKIFADHVNELTQGRVKIEVFPLGQLGTSAENVSNVQTGITDITFLTMAMIGSMCDEWSALDTPYLFDSIEQCVAVCDTDTEVMKYLSEKLYNETGVKYLFSFYFGTRETTCNTPIYTPADMKGKQFRSLAFEFYMSYIDSLGAVATQIDITELAQALQSGMVAGQENPVDVIISRQMFEYQKYLMMTNHMICCQGVVMNGDKWNSISEKDQELIMQAAQMTIDESNAYIFAKTSEQIQYLKDQGMTIIDETNGLDIAAFRETVGKYINEKYGKKYATVYNLIESTKASVE